MSTSSRASIAGGAAARDDAPPGETHKGFVLGMHRTVAPEATLDLACRWMPLFGITRIANVTGLDPIGVPVVMVARPNAKSLSVAQGKGLTLAAAQASGLMEAIESHHAENVTLPLKLATPKQLSPGHRLIDVARLPRHARGSFHGDVRTLWIEGHDVMDGGSRWVPYAVVHTDFTIPLPPGSDTFLMTSSGLASGNHPLEAVCHGLCELIERDAVTLFRARGAAARAAARLDLDTVDDPACRDVLARYDRAGIAVSAWNVTSDAGVAAFYAAIVEREANVQRPITPMGGMGCHPAREVALLRALTEAAQSRLTLVAGARDDMVGQRPEPAEYIRAVRRFHEERTAPGPRVSYADVPTCDHATFEADVSFVLDRLRAVGCDQVVVVDLTKAEIGIPVMRVVVPGLEALSDVPGYLPGARARAAQAGVGAGRGRS